MERYYYAGSFIGSYLDEIFRLESKKDRDEFVADRNAYFCLEKEFRPITREMARKAFPRAFSGAKWKPYYQDGVEYFDIYAQRGYSITHKFEEKAFVVDFNGDIWEG